MTEVYFSKTWSILGYHDTLIDAQHFMTEKSINRGPLLPILRRLLMGAKHSSQKNNLFVKKSPIQKYIVDLTCTNNSQRK